MSFAFGVGLSAVARWYEVQIRKVLVVCCGVLILDSTGDARTRQLSEACLDKPLTKIQPPQTLRACRSLLQWMRLGKPWRQDTNKLRGCYLLATMRACLLSQALDAVLKLRKQPLCHTSSTGIALEVVEQVCHQPDSGASAWSHFCPG